LFEGLSPPKPPRGDGTDLGSMDCDVNQSYTVRKRFADSRHKDVLLAEMSSESLHRGCTFVHGSLTSENYKTPLTYNVLYFNLGGLELCLEGLS